MQIITERFCKKNGNVSRFANGRRVTLEAFDALLASADSDTITIEQTDRFTRIHHEVQ